MFSCMCDRAKRIFLFLLIFLGLGATVLAQDDTAADQAVLPTLPDISPEQLNAFIKDLEDPAAREQLIQQLTTLAQIKSADSEADNKVQDATGDLLQAISKRVETLKSDFNKLLDRINTFPQAFNWLRHQFADPGTRKVWGKTLFNLVLVLGAGYLAYLFLYLLLWHPRRILARQIPESITVNGLLLLVALLLNVLPILAFATGAYICLGIVDPIQQMRLVALAWMNAAIITRLILAIACVIFVPNMPYLRMLPMEDHSAHYGVAWIRRLAVTLVYGYFALQVALLLGLPTITYSGAVYLLGLLVVILVLVLLWQNRLRVATVIRGSQDPAVHFQGLRHRLAELWFLLAALYVLMLYGLWVLEVDGGFVFLLRATFATLLILIVGYFLWRLSQKVFIHGFRIPFLETHFPGLQRRFNRYIPILRWALQWFIYGLIGVAILQVWGIDAFAWLTSEPGRVLGATAMTILSIVAVSFIIWELVGAWIENYLAKTEQRGENRVHSNRARTLLALAQNALLVVLAVISTLLVLTELGVNIAPLLAGAGVLGVAVGFGSQKLVQDVITGAFILFEDLIAVGDVVNVGDKDGIVEAVSMRNVRLRDLSGVVHTVPYSTITTVSNLTKDFSYYLLDVAIAYREDADQVMELLRQIGSEMQQDSRFMHRILAPLEILGVDAFADSAVIIKARIKTLPIEQWSVGREFNRRMKRRFDEQNIEIPFPHRTLYFGVDKQGQAPSAQISLRSSSSTEVSPTALDKIAESIMPSQYINASDNK